MNYQCSGPCKLLIFEIWIVMCHVKYWSLEISLFNSFPHTSRFIFLRIKRFRSESSTKLTNQTNNHARIYKHGFLQVQQLGLLHTKPKPQTHTTYHQTVNLSVKNNTSKCLIKILNILLLLLLFNVYFW